MLVNPLCLSITYEYKILVKPQLFIIIYEGWNFNSGNYLFTNDTK